MKAQKEGFKEKQIGTIKSNEEGRERVNLKEG